MDDALHRTDTETLRLGVVTDTLRAESGINLIDLLAFGNRAIRAFGFTDITIDAFVGNQQSHIVNWKS